MPNVESTPDYISMEVKCPNCGQSMRVDVGLTTTAGTTGDEVECPGCHEQVLTLFPGPVIRGPFLVA